MKTKAYIFRLDDIVPFDGYILVDSITKEHQKYSKYPVFITNAWSNILFLADEWFFYNIKNYNKGLITTEQFTKKMSSQFLLEESVFIDIWKSAYKISPKIKEKLLVKVNSLDEDEIFIFGVTNQIHFEYFLEQLDKKNNNFNKCLSYNSLNHSESVDELMKEGFSFNDSSNIEKYNISIASLDITEMSGIDSLGHK